jgi:predicted dehydrogenase
MKKINLAFVGAGFISQICHLPNFAQNKKVVLQAICDPNYQLAKKIAKKYSINKVYQNHKDLLANERNIQGVVLSVPRHKTYSVALDVLKTGKNLFSEKPMAQSFQAAKKLYKTAIKERAKYVIGHMKRFDESIIFIKKLFKKKDFNLDSLVSVYYKSFAGDSFGDFKKYIKKKKYDPHSLSNEVIKNKVPKIKKTIYLKFLNTHSHAVNLLRFLFGEIKIFSKNINNNGEGIIFFKKNKKDLILSTRLLRSNDWHEEIEIVFKKYKIIINFPMPLLVNQPGKITITNLLNSTEKKVLLKWKWSFSNQANEFINTIIKNKNNSCDAKYCINDFKIIENIFT